MKPRLAPQNLPVEGYSQISISQEQTTDLRRRLIKFDKNRESDPACLHGVCQMLSVNGINKVCSPQK